MQLPAMAAQPQPLLLRPAATEAARADGGGGGGYGGAGYVSGGQYLYGQARVASGPAAAAAPSGTGGSSSMRVGAPDFTPQQAGVGPGPVAMQYPVGMGVPPPPPYGSHQQYGYGGGEVTWVPVITGGASSMQAAGYGAPYLMEAAGALYYPPGPVPSPGVPPPGPYNPAARGSGDAGMTTAKRPGGLWKPPPLQGEDTRL
eukprot:SM000078S22111  [mRNA]  locus=s78:556369:557573:+ [translate_table: standard]